MVRTPDGPRIRRLRRAGRTWVAYGDNPECRPEALPRPADVVGQVLWSSRDHAEDAGPSAPGLDMRVLRMQMAAVIARLESTGQVGT